MDQSLRLLSKEVCFSQEQPRSLTEILEVQHHNHSLYKALKSLLASPRAPEAAQEDHSVQRLIAHISKCFEQCMGLVLGTFNASTALGQNKQPAPDALALENQQLSNQIADLQANLTLSETKLASQ